VRLRSQECSFHRPSRRRLETTVRTNA